MSDIDASFLRKIMQACHKALYVAGFFSCFINILMLTTSLYMLQVYDRVLASRSFDTLIYLTLAAIIALVALTLLDIARSRVLVHVSYWLDNALSPTALAKSADQLLQGYAYGPQALRDIATIRQFVAGAGIFSLFDAPWVPIYLFVIFMLSPLLGLLATLGAVILFILAILNERMTRKLLNEATIRAMGAQYYIDASLRNAEIIQAMGMMKNIIQHWESQNGPVLQLQTIASNRAAIILAISKFMRLTLQIFMLGVGAYLVIENQLTGGAMIAGSILLSRALAPVEQAISVWKQLLAARQAYYRLQQHFSATTRYVSNITLPPPQGTVTLENVMYHLSRADKPILSNISLQIKAGEVIAVIGPSGAGKSTLARLIVGALKTTSGDVRLDGADVYTWDRNDFGRYTGYLPQDIELFTGTVKDNIARMGVIEDEAVVTAAQIAGVHNMILHLPKGYDTYIGNNSYILSGGQRQRIALARAIYHFPRLLVLDEPNSNLDSEGEESLLHAILAMRAKGTTQIIIAHHPSIIKQVDKIIFLVEGQIKMIGPRDQVLEKLQQITQQHGKV
ncbi:MAG: hypothetical protein A3E84_02515 [Gammaproteobacteria bacterium RIFCSPHIGHO2_12_FULL_42_13]|nr:MAG: hypothetical protein A3E84_02515 [Gammaproteobacteria bacterium RIFCSPHIGHO2_12_FULL_42_13]